MPTRNLDRDQLGKCDNLPGKLFPVITLMLDNPETLWGDCVLSDSC
jgi:hypothetical protein